MERMIDLVHRLESKYPTKVPKDDPDYIKLIKNYWTGKAKIKISIKKKVSNPCRVTHLKSGITREFNNFAEAAKAYNHSRAWISSIYRLPNHSNGKYLVEKLEEDK